MNRRTLRTVAAAAALTLALSIASPASGGTAGGNARTTASTSSTPGTERVGIKRYERMVGENIAVGYQSGKAVVRGWIRSTGHRRNILRKPYRLLGVGVVRDKHGHVWASQVFARR